MFFTVIENQRIYKFKSQPIRSKTLTIHKKLHYYTVFDLLKNVCFIIGPRLRKQFGMDIP